MKLFNFFKTTKKEVTPTKDTEEKTNIRETLNKKDSLEKKEKYYETKLRIFCQMINNVEKNTYKIKTSLDNCFINLINSYNSIDVKIENKDELIEILKIFFDKNQDLNSNKETIFDFIANDFNFIILTSEELKEKKENDEKLKKLRSIIYQNYQAIKKHSINKDFAWMYFCFKNKLNKNDLINNLKIALLERNISESTIKSEIDNLNIVLSFGNIPTENEVNAYRNSLEKNNINDIKTTVEFYKEKIKKEDNDEYIKLYSIFYWARVSYKLKKNKEELLDLIKELVNKEEYELIDNSIKFEGICSYNRLIEYQNDLEKYVVIINLKKYINNWKQIKTNQINDDQTISIEEKTTYFKELEEDYLNITNSINSSLEEIENCLKTINSRDYIKNLSISSTKIMKETLGNRQVDNMINTDTSKKNTLEKELEDIKRWQETVSNLRKY